MAFTATTTAGPDYISQDPWTITETTVSFNLHGTTTFLAVAGTKHGGPSGVEPWKVEFERRGGDSQDTAWGCNVTNFDTTNDEVDYDFVTDSAGGTADETIILVMRCYFLTRATDGVDLNDDVIV
jgi:hypothetical protein